MKHGQQFTSYINSLNAYLSSKGFLDGKRLLSKLIERSLYNEEEASSLEGAFISYSTVTFREYCKPIADYWGNLSDANAIDSIDAAVCSKGVFKR